MKFYYDLLILLLNILVYDWNDGTPQNLFSYRRGNQLLVSINSDSAKIPYFHVQVDSQGSPDKLYQIDPYRDYHLPKDEYFENTEAFLGGLESNGVQIDFTNPNRGFHSPVEAV